jgi:hypothetical protein
LEDLELFLDVNDQILAPSSSDAVVQGLIIQGACWDEQQGRIIFSDDLRWTLPPSKLKWRLKSTRSEVAHVSSIPVYMNENRKHLVSQVLLSTSSNVPNAQWAQRSVAFVLQAPMV